MISIVQGDDKTFTFNIKTAAGAAYDLTGCTVFATVKKDSADTDASALIKKTLSVSVPASGIAYWYSLAADTKYMLGVYLFDIQLKTASGDINTLIVDIFMVTSEITIRTT